MEQHDKVHTLLRKLHALAQRGVGGEKENVEKALRRLMKRHGVTLEDIAEERKERRLFCFKTKEERSFMLQVISSVNGSSGAYTTRRGQRGRFWVELTTSEHLEAVMKIEHYWPMFKEERALFYEAFIQANKLYRKSSDKNKVRAEDLTEEGARRLMRMAEMMRGIRTDTPNKRLERAEKLTA